MKLKILFLLFFPPLLSFGDIIFPDSLYVVHKETGYKIMIGTAPEFVERHFGKPQKKILRFKFQSPDYEIWDIVYDSFEIRYQTYDNIITSIKLLNNSFSTSQNVEIGYLQTNVINIYGTPTYITINDKGEAIYQYEKFINELNIDGEYTLLQFTFSGNKVTEILFDIVIEI
jgi:hypothetical protein